jgi:type I restriction enzyme S subunit
MRLSYQSRGQYLLKAKNVRNGFIDLTAAGLISDEDFERCPTRCRPTKNDILIVRRGLGTGRAAIVQSDLPAAISNDILLVRPVVDTQFFLNWLQSPFGQDWIARVAGIGVRASLSSSGLKRMPVPLPSSDEQRRTVAELSEGLSATSKFDMLVDRILKCGESLRHEILKWGFEGKLLTSGRP